MDSKSNKISKILEKLTLRGDKLRINNEANRFLNHLKRQNKVILKYTNKDLQAYLKNLKIHISHQLRVAVLQKKVSVCKRTLKVRFKLVKGCINLGKSSKNNTII